MSLQRSQSLATRFTGPAIVLFAAFVAITPELISGPSYGHDFEFHLVSWIDTLHSWREGIVYPQWQPSSNFFAGEPRFIFYPPLTSMTGAVLGAMFPWHVVLILMTFLLLAGTGLATRALARESIRDGPATLAGCAAIFFGYALFTAYVRSDFAEMTGGFWIPLLLLFILRDRNPTGPLRQRAFDGSTAPLALVVAGAWLSNPPVGVMAGYLLAGVAITLAFATRSWAPLLRALAGEAVGTALAALYLIPAVWERHSADLLSAIDYPPTSIQNSWLFGHHAGALFIQHDRVLFHISVIAIGMIGIALTGLLICWRRGSLPGKRRWWLPLAAIPLVVLFLQLPISLPIWNLLPKLRYLQFPWRWLVAVEAPMGIFFAAAVWTTHRRWRIAAVSVCAALFLLNTLGVRRFFFDPGASDYCVTAVLNGYRNRTLADDEQEYAPPTADDSLVAMHLPDACLTADPHIALGRPADDGTLTWNPTQHTCTATFSAQSIPGKARTEHFQIHAVASSPSYLVLRLRTYPAWQVRVNGRVIHSMPERDDGLMAVPVPRGHVHVTVNWTTTPDVIAGRWFSVFALFLLLILATWERRRSPPRL